MFRRAADALMFCSHVRITSDQAAASLERQRQAQSYRPENGFHRDRIQTRTPTTKRKYS